MNGSVTRPTRGLVRRGSDRGSVILPAMLVVVACAALAAAMTTVQAAHYNETRRAATTARCFYTAEGAVNEAVATYSIRGRAAFEAMQYPRTVNGIPCTVNCVRGDADGTMNDNLVRFRCNVVIDGVSSTVQAILRETPGNGIPVFGVFGDQGVTIGSDSAADSYDSAINVWSVLATLTYPGTTYKYAGLKGSIGSNRSISLGSKAAVLGSAQPGPGFSVSKASDAKVSGSTVPALATTTLPSITVPSYAASGSKSVTGGSTSSIASGNYNFASISAGSDATINITGPANIVVNSLSIGSNVRVVSDTTAGPVRFWVTGSFFIDSNARLTTSSNRPKDLSMQVSAAGITASIGSAVVLTGTVYAPLSTVRVDSNAQISGFVVGRTVSIDSGVRLHYDESIARESMASSAPTYTRVSWWATGAR